MSSDTGTRPSPAASPAPAADEGCRLDPQRGAIAASRSRGTPVRSTADRWMRRLLGLDPDAPAGSAAGARKAFQTSIMISAARCLFMYIVLPFVLPIIGVTTGVGPVIGLIISVLAMASITFSMRRFFGSDHPKRWWYAALGGAVFAFMAVSTVIDLTDLLT